MILKFFASVLFGLAWVKVTRIGPVVLVVDESRGWGVHGGDLIGLAPLALVTLTLATGKLDRINGITQGEMK